MKRKMKTLLILMLALCSLSAGEIPKTNWAQRPIGFLIVTNLGYTAEAFWSAELVGKIETNWVDSFWQTELGTVSSNTYIITEFHGKTTTNLIESATITNLTRRYNIKQLRDYTGPFPNLYATNQIITNFVWH